MLKAVGADQAGNDVVDIEYFGNYIKFVGFAFVAEIACVGGRR